MVVFDSLEFPFSLVTLLFLDSEREKAHRYDKKMQNHFQQNANDHK